MMPGQQPHGWVYDEYGEGKAAAPPADDVAVFEWRPDDMGAEPADWMTANPALGPRSPERMLEFIGRHTEFTLTSWQRDVVEQLYKDPEDFDRRLAAVLTGQIWRGPVGAFPPVAPPRPSRAQNRRNRNTYWVYVDEIQEALAQVPKVDETRQRLIDEISQDVEAKIARLQCPRFPRAE